MKQIVKYVMMHFKTLMIGTIALIMVIAFDLFNPWLQQQFIDKGIIGGEVSVIPAILGGILGVCFVKVVFGYIKEYTYDRFSTKVQKDLRMDMFRHIQSLEFKYFDGMNTGELMSRIGEDVYAIWDAIGFWFRFFAENAVYIITSTIILFFYSWKLTLICLALVIPVAVMAIFLEKKSAKFYSEISDKTADINVTAQEDIAGVRLVKAFAREDYEVKKFMKLNKDYYNLNVGLSNVNGKYYSGIDFFVALVQVALIVIGGIFVIKGELTIGALVAFNGYLSNLIWPIKNVGQMVTLMAQTIESMKKVGNILDRPSEVVSKDNAVAPKQIQGGIEFNNVSFGYNDEEVLHDINLNIPAGSTVAIMGTTGSGKSTLLNLIGRYYETDKGTIKVDGVDVKDYELGALRSRMAIVPQDNFLFSDSVKNNITFSNTDASKEEIETVCEISCTNEFVHDLPDDIDTEVGERGIGLSGGQKQRISIARALARKSSILILDDSTSALDMETEHELLKNLNNKSKDATTFIVAHRISAVKNADMILYLEDGRIVEQGNHQELLAKKGKYYEIYREQFKDFDKTEVV